MRTSPPPSSPDLPRQTRKVGTFMTEPSANNSTDTVWINPCACIDKLMKVAAARLEQASRMPGAPKDALNLEHEPRLFSRPGPHDGLDAAQRDARQAQRFKANVQAYELGRTASAVYEEDERARWTYVEVGVAGGLPVKRFSAGKWRVATESELKDDFGLTYGSADLRLERRTGERTHPTHFKAELYVPEQKRFCYPMPAVLAFRGTVVDTWEQTRESWQNNAQQALDLHSAYYNKAVDLGLMLRAAKNPIAIVGHSLGGGLAAACAQASGRPAWTFNAAGLRTKTVEKYSFSKPLPAHIEAYRHIGEVLMVLQETDMLLPGIIIGPAALGVRRDIGCSDNSWSTKDRHRMLHTMVSFRAQLMQEEDALRQALGVQCNSRVIV